MTYLEAIGLNKEADDKLTKLSSEIKNLRLQQIFHDASNLVWYIGGCLVYIDTGENAPTVLKQPLNLRKDSAELAKD